MDFSQIYVREAEDYTAEELKEKFQYGGKGIEFREFVKSLVTAHVLVYKKSNSKIASENETDGDEEEEFYKTLTDDDYDKKSAKYRFSFVGIVVYKDKVIYSYPKYITCPKEQIKKKLYAVIRVIEKYHWEKSHKNLQDISFIYDYKEDEKADNTLPVIFFLLDDYLNYGLYEKEETILENNGTGEIQWQKTVDETTPFIDNELPYYVDNFTRKNENDDLNFIRRLHAYVIHRCNAEIKATGIDYFLNITTDDLLDEDSIEFEDRDYVLYRLEQEINSVFDDRKLRVLKALYAYFKECKPLVGDNDDIQLIGTNSFNLVWEWVCKKVFDADPSTKLKDALTDEEKGIVLSDKIGKILEKLSSKDYLGYKLDTDSAIIKLIEQPKWQKADGKIKPVKTIIPDALKFAPNKDKNFIFYILDGKYYCPKWDDNGNIEDQPGAQDIIKQYMYRLAYRDFLEEYEIKYIRNYFLLPKCGENDQAGNAWFNFLDRLDLGKIGIRFLDPEEIYADYLQNKTKDLIDLDKAADEVKGTTTE